MAYHEVLSHTWSAEQFHNSFTISHLTAQQNDLIVFTLSVMLSININCHQLFILKKLRSELFSKYYILGITKNFLVALVCTRPLCISSRYRALSWGPFRFSVPHLTKAKMCRILFFYITQHSDWNIHKALIDTFLVVVWLTRKTVKLSVDIWHELSCHAIPSCKCIWGCLLVQIRLQNCISKAGDHHHHF